MTESSPNGAILSFTLRPELRGRMAKPPNNPDPQRLPARIPRISKLMALALHLEQLVGQGRVKNWAEISRLGHVSRARLTQIMSLLYLAPAIQEHLLFLSCSSSGAEPVRERTLRRITRLTCWREQERLYGQLLHRRPEEPISTSV
jgi:hypothetical protein